MKKSEMCSRLIAIKYEMKSLKEELDEIEGVLKDDLQEEFRKNGSATKTYGNYAVNLTSQIRMLADSQALKDDGIFDKYSKPSVAEYLKVTRIKG